DATTLDERQQRHHPSGTALCCGPRSARCQTTRWGIRRIRCKLGGSGRWRLGVLSFLLIRIDWSSLFRRLPLRFVNSLRSLPPLLLRDSLLRGPCVMCSPVVFVGWAGMVIPVCPELSVEITLGVALMLSRRRTVVRPLAGLSRPRQNPTLAQPVES